MLAARDGDVRPSLTFNKTYIHCLLVINQIKKRPPGITVRPTAMGGSVRVEIRLRARAPYQIHQDGNQVAVDFGPASGE